MKTQSNNKNEQQMTLLKIKFISISNVYKWKHVYETMFIGIM